MVIKRLIQALQHLAPLPFPRPSHFLTSVTVKALVSSIRSLLPKFVLFTALAHLDVLAVSESWLRKATKNPEISIPNYKMFRQDRTVKGGRVVIYCRDSLQSSVIQSRSVPKHFKLLHLKIHLSINKSLTIAACYRPPSAPSCALDTICDLIVPHLSSELVLLGDLNWDMLNVQDRGQYFPFG